MRYQSVDMRRDMIQIIFINEQCWSISVKFWLLWYCYLFQSILRLQCTLLTSYPRKNLRIHSHLRFMPWCHALFNVILICQNCHQIILLHRRQWRRFLTMYITWQWLRVDRTIWVHPVNNMHAQNGEYHVLYQDCTKTTFHDVQNVSW